MNGPRLEWISHSNRLEVFEIPSSIKIGRLPIYADIAVLDGNVEKGHAVINTIEGRYHIHNTGIYGTYVNGSRIEDRRLCSGDIIRIAEAIEFQYREGPESANKTEIAIPHSDLDACWLNDRRVIIGIYEGGDSRDQPPIVVPLFNLDELVKT